jgi:hypothetical protein
VFENRVLGRIFGPKRDKMIGGQRKLRNEEIPRKYYNNDQVKEVEIGRSCSTYGREAHWILVEKPERM